MTATERKASRLINEKSPLPLPARPQPGGLVPVGRGGVAKARADDKPVFLSIGYSTCHWCHV